MVKCKYYFVNEYKTSDLMPRPISNANNINIVNAYDLHIFLFCNKAYVFMLLDFNIKLISFGEY